MPIVDPSELPSLLPARTRILGLDLGEKTIGVAVSDSGLSLATPVETIRRRRFREDLAHLRDLMAGRNVGALVIGLPLNMDGTEGPRCQSVRQFAANLQDAGIDMPIAFWDERLTTAEMERFLIEEADLSRKRRGQVIDKMAARTILQSALDAIAARR